MDAFDAYKIYIALKSHFNSDYDFNKYHGKTSVTPVSYTHLTLPTILLV